MGVSTGPPQRENTRPVRVKPVASRFRGTPPAAAAAAASLVTAHRAPPAPRTASDPDWERAMDARLAQWRYMNLVAVAELQAEEKAHCAHLSALAAQLEAAMDDVAALTAALDASRAHAAGAAFADRAAAGLSRLEAAVDKLDGADGSGCSSRSASASDASDHSLAHSHARGVVDRVLDSLRVLPVRNIVADSGAAAGLAREIARFRVAGVAFADAVAKKGAVRNEVVEALEDLARVVAEEAPGVREELCKGVAAASESIADDIALRAAVTSRARSRARGRARSVASNSIIAPRRVRA
jgi:hypothetical protein